MPENEKKEVVENNATEEKTIEEVKDVTTPIEAKLQENESVEDEVIQNLENQAEEEVQQEISASPSEENKQEEATPAPATGFIKPVDAKSKEYVQEQINNARKTFKAAYDGEMKRNKIIGIVFIGVMVVLAVLTWVIPAMVNYINYLLIAALVFFVGVIVMTRLSRKKMDVAVGDYTGAYGTYSDSYVYDNKDFKDIEMYFRGKPDEEVAKSMHFKKDVYHVGSRDVIHGSIDKVKFEAADISVKTGDVKVKKTQKTVFVGKMVTLDLENKDNGRILMYMKGCGDAEPDDLEDVNKMEIAGLNSDWVVYSSNEGYEKVFTKPVIDALNEFKTDAMLNDLVFTIQKKRIILGLGYSDDLMIIPLESDFKADGVEHYKNDMEKVITLTKALEKNKYFTK